MSENKINISEKTCSLKEVLDIIGGKWAIPMIYILSKGKIVFCLCPRSLSNPPYFQIRTVYELFLLQYIE